MRSLVLLVAPISFRAAALTLAVEIEGKVLGSMSACIFKLTSVKHFMGFPLLQEAKQTKLQVLNLDTAHLSETAV